MAAEVAEAAAGAAGPDLERLVSALAGLAYEYARSVPVPEPTEGATGHIRTAGARVGGTVSTRAPTDAQEQPRATPTGHPGPRVPDPA